MISCRDILCCYKYTGLNSSPHTQMCIRPYLLQKCRREPQDKNTEMDVTVQRAVVQTHRQNTCHSRNWKAVVHIQQLHWTEQEREQTEPAVLSFIT